MGETNKRNQNVLYFKFFKVATVYLEDTIDIYFNQLQLNQLDFSYLFNAFEIISCVEVALGYSKYPCSTTVFIHIMY